MAEDGLLIGEIGISLDRSGAARCEERDLLIEIYAGRAEAAEALRRAPDAIDYLVDG